MDIGSSGILIEGLVGWAEARCPTSFEQKNCWVSVVNPTRLTNWEQE
jgi:hypothetical protein